MAEASERLICSSDALVDGGDGVRFTVEREGNMFAAFVVRSGQHVYAYLNRCTHRDIELDWEPGKFFDVERRYLICATHGALYHPHTGICIAGPCNKGLVKLAVIEKNSGVYLISSGETRESKR